MKVCNTACVATQNGVMGLRIPFCFQEQIEWAVKYGADYIVAETFSEYAEAKVALECIQKYGNGKRDL